MILIYKKGKNFKFDQGGVRTIYNYVPLLKQLFLDVSDSIYTFGRITDSGNVIYYRLHIDYLETFKNDIKTIINSVINDIINNCINTINTIKLENFELSINDTVLYTTSDFFGKIKMWCDIYDKEMKK